MPKFQLNLAAPSRSQTFKVQIEEDDPRGNALIGKKIGEAIPGDALGFEGYEFELRGGSDADGFPMVPSVGGGVRRKILTAGGVGYRTQRKGLRKRRRVRGNTVTPDCYQLNLKITKSGSRPIEEFL
ncbi:MAG: S6e family ribosomal protein [Candidatus Hodarchaeota archaeon]